MRLRSKSPPLRLLRLPKPKLLRLTNAPAESTSPVKNVAVVVAVEAVAVTTEVDAATMPRDAVDTTVDPRLMTMASWWQVTVPSLVNAVVVNVADVEVTTTTVEVPKKAATVVTSEEEVTEEAVEVVAKQPRPDLPPQTTNEEATGTTN